MLKFLHIFARVLVFKDARKQFLADGMQHITSIRQTYSELSLSQNREYVHLSPV